MEKRIISFLTLFTCLSNLTASSKTEECFAFLQKVMHSASDQIQGISEEEGVIKIIDKGVYIKIVHEGTGSERITATDSPLITFKAYQLGPEEDKSPYVVDSPVRLDLNHTILGIQLGMEGMRIGEIRRIYIHPSFAHGKYSPLVTYGTIYYDIELVSLNGK